jgi:hypothetical protein
MERYQERGWLKAAGYDVRITGPGAVLPGQQ